MSSITGQEMCVHQTSGAVTQSLPLVFKFRNAYFQSSLITV